MGMSGTSETSGGTFVPTYGGNKPIPKKNRSKSLTFLKADDKVYLSDGEFAPEGIQTEKGPRGGEYYRTTAKKGGDSYSSTSKKGDYTEDITAWTTEDELAPLLARVKTGAAIAFKAIPEAHWKGILIKVVNIAPVAQAIAEFNSVLDCIFLTRSAGSIEWSEIKHMYNDDLKHVKKPWTVILTHELGHRVLSQSQAQNEWYSMEHAGKGVTKYAREGWAGAENNADERFAEGYLYYIHNPDKLFLRDRETYEFLKTNIFNGFEYHDPEEEREF